MTVLPDCGGRMINVPFLQELPLPEPVTGSSEPQTQRPPKKKTRLGCILKVCGILLLLLCILIGVGPYLIPTDSVKAMLEQTLLQKTGRQCRIGDVRIDFWNGGFAADNVVIPDLNAQDTPILNAKKLTVSADMSSLLQGNLRIRSIKIEDARLSLMRQSEHDWNVKALAGLSTSTLHKMLADTTDQTQTSQSDTEQTQTGRNDLLLAASVTAPAAASPIAVDVRTIELVAVCVEINDQQSGIHGFAQIPHLSLQTDKLGNPFACEGSMLLQNQEGTPAIATVEANGEINLFDGYKLLQPTGNLAVDLEILEPNKLQSMLRLQLPVLLAMNNLTSTVHVQLHESSCDLRGHLLTTQTNVNYLQYALNFGPELTVPFNVEIPFGQNAVSGKIDLASELISGSVSGSLNFDNAVTGDLEINTALQTKSAGFDGLLHVAGPLTFLNGSVSTALQVSSDTIALKDPNLIGPVVASLGGKIEYVGQELRCTNLTLSALDSAATLNGSIRMPETSLAMPVFNFNLAARTDLTKISAALKPESRYEDATIDGKLQIDATLKNGTTKPFAFTVHAQTQDGQPVYLQRNSIDAPLKVNLGPAVFDLGVSFGWLNDYIIDRLQLSTDPLTLVANGQLDMLKKQSNGEYRIQLDPGKAGQLLLTLIPRQLATTIQSLNGMGKFDYTDPWLTLSDTSLNGSLRINREYYPVNIRHDLRIATDRLSGFTLNNVSLTMTQDNAPVLEVAAAGKLERIEQLLAGGLNVQARGSTQPTLGLLQSLSLLEYPTDYRFGGSFETRGKLDFSDNGWQTFLGLVFNEPAVYNKNTPVFRDQRVNGDLQLSYERGGKASLIGLNLTTSTGAVILSAQGSASRTDSGLWQIDKDSSLTLKSNMAGCAQILPSFFPPNVKAVGNLVLQVHALGTTLALSCEAKLSSDQILIASPDFGDRPLQLKQVAGACSLLVNLQDETTDRIVINNLDLTTPFAQLRAVGTIPSARIENDKLLFGNGSQLNVRSELDGTAYAEAVPYPLSSLRPGVDLTTVQIKGTIQPASIIELATLTDWRDLMCYLKLTDSALAVDSINLSGRKIENLHTELSLDNGILALNNMKTQLGGYIWARANLDFRPENQIRPVWSTALATSGLEIPVLLKDVSRYCVFTSGKLHLPNEEISQSAQFVFSGLAKNEILSTLRASNGSLRIQALTMLVQDKTTNWADWMKYDFPVDLGNVINRPLGSEYDQSTSTLTKEIRYDEIRGHYQIADRKLTLQEVEVQGGNTADFLVEGTVILDPEVVLASDMDLKVYIINHVNRTLPLDDLFGSIKELNKLPKESQQALKADLMELLEDMGRSRKLYVTFRGSLQSPRPDATRMTKTIAKEIGQFLIMRALTGDVGSIAPGGNSDLKDILNKLGGGIRKQMENNQGSDSDKKKDDNPFSQLEDIFK